MASAKNRQTVGVVQAISASRGILVSLPADFESHGVIKPRTLISSFQRYFRVGEQVTVAIAGITMSRSDKTFDLLLVESPTRLASVQKVSSNRTGAVTTRLIPSPACVR